MTARAWPAYRLLSSKGLGYRRPAASRAGHPTDRGRELERRLSADQRALVARAYREAGADAVEGFRTVLRNLINDEDRKRFDSGEASAHLAARS